ncbi:expansin-B15-like [Andrographis paniculata]|uniref:expansin-B15-like n=1 Tax=Andrographis paniculata TaxID=175694 RepID=UPI0021E73E9C|nr:expansin-B15-like [Andrographis paniculata]
MVAAALSFLSSNYNKNVLKLNYLFLLSLIIASTCHSFSPKLLNFSKLQYSGGGGGWTPARASWYGNPSGAGSDGGACGYKTAVDTAPFSSLITAAASSLYDSGNACGTCYQVKCTKAAVCSGAAVTVVITDECPGCDSQNLLFDLSGTSFGTMANRGEANQLRNVGIEDIQYRKVACNFGGTTVAFRVDEGSNPNYFATAIEYEDGDGLEVAELRRGGGGGEWLRMSRLWGAVHKVDLPGNYPAPFSVRLTSKSGKVVVADHVIPANYVPGKTYRSMVNF